jgi:hypothetical protein
VWPTEVKDWVGLVADGTAVVVVLLVATLWLRGRNPLTFHALYVDRRRTVGPLLRARGGSRLRGPALAPRRRHAVAERRDRAGGAGRAGVARRCPACR